MKCPNGHEVTDNVKYCPTCGAEIVSGNKFCTKCGSERMGTEKFCSQCGTPFDVEPNINHVVLNEGKSSSFKRYLPYILGAFVLLAIVGYFNSKDSSNDGSNANGVAVGSTSTGIEASGSTKETIIKRLEKIFDDVVKGKTNDYEERYFSSDFNRIYNEVAEIDDRFAQEGNLGFWDSGFWDMAQDEVKLSATIKDVYDVKDKEAMAKIAFKFTYFDGSSHNSNEDIKVVLENGKWVLDDLHGYKKQMKAFVEENKNYQPSTTQDKIASSSGNDYSSNSSNTSSSRTFYSEQIVIGYLANQSFRASDGLTMRVDGDGRLYVDGDYAGVLSVLRYNSTSALLRYGGGMYGEGKLTVQIVGDKFTLTDPTDGTVYYQR